MISHAYNYQKSSPVYRFMADLQFGNMESLHFELSALIKDKPFYPRVSCQNLIFSPATWFIQWEELSARAGNNPDQLIRDLLTDKNIPLRFLICEGDNELLIDLDHPDLFLLFKDVFKKQKQLILKEFLYDKDHLAVTNKNQQQLNHELIAIVINEEKGYSPKNDSPPLGLDKDIIRNFSLGSEWLYFKLYGGINSADHILVNEIFPIVKALFAIKVVDKFFFVRYHDPDPHLRLRFKLADRRQLQAVTEPLQLCFKKLEDSGLIWKVQVDTYTRELERYGNSMQQTELIFSCDSLAILQLLQMTNIKDDRVTRIAVGIRLAADLLKLTIADLNGCILFCNRMKEILKQDCDIKFQTEKRIRATFEKNELQLLKFMTNNPKGKAEAAFIRRQNQIKKSLATLNNQYPQRYPETCPELMVPYIHMSINRLFSNDQKFYEYLVYNYLFKYFNTIKNKP